MERGIRSFAVGRNNWMFSRISRGARISAAVYSLIETAKADYLHPDTYPTYLMDMLPYRPDWKLTFPGPTPFPARCAITTKAPARIGSRLFDEAVLRKARRGRRWDQRRPKILSQTGAVWEIAEASPTASFRRGLEKHRHPSACSTTFPKGRVSFFAFYARILRRFRRSGPEIRTAKGRPQSSIRLRTALLCSAVFKLRRISFRCFSFSVWPVLLCPFSGCREAQL
ncbi:hypothetical protein C6I21_06440 [Alkalicoccus urumqiensis]|uniref:Transposase IS66 C-terminal domain-containing protein n=1 Tax=Alkalicoccus urumqiensis TaxID=1548213 RepID=A0A2P6MI52_ALKUR|nr:hypothetical protein C6I21_06440 [Alkalicoccus urumqiensis]